MKRITNSEIQEYVRDLSSFKANSTHANWYRDYDILSRGQLPLEDYQQLVEDIEIGGEIYVVFSYATPIAWSTPDRLGFRVPDVKYSQTTSAAQTRVKRGIDDRANYLAHYAF